MGANDVNIEKLKREVKKEIRALRRTEPELADYYKDLIFTENKDEYVPSIPAD